MDPVKISSEASHILDNLNEGGEANYILSSRKIPLFQPLGDIALCSRSLSLIWAKSKEKFWHGFAVNIPCNEKDNFLIEAPNRIPGILWFFHPESATVAGTNYIFRELSGEECIEKIRHLEEKEKPVYDSILSKLFRFAQIMHLTGGTSGAIPWEMKLNAYFSAVYHLVISIDQLGNIPSRPMLTSHTLRNNLAFVLDTCSPEYSGLNTASEKFLEGKEDARRPTFWSNMALHRRCVLCEQVFSTWTLLKNHQ